MNSRQRIQAAINHEIPDRVPLDMGSTIVTGIAATKYAELLTVLGLDNITPRIYDVYLMLAQPDLAILDQLAVDTMILPWLMRRDRWGIRLDRWKEWGHPLGPRFQVPANFNPIQAEDGSLLMKRDGRGLRQDAPGGPLFRLHREPAVYWRQPAGHRNGPLCPTYR